MLTKAEWNTLGRLFWAAKRDIIVETLLGIGFLVSGFLAFLTNEIAFYIISAALLLGSVVKGRSYYKRIPREPDPWLLALLRFHIRAGYVVCALLAIGLFVGAPLYHHFHG